MGDGGVMRCGRRPLLWGQEAHAESCDGGWGPGWGRGERGRRALRGLGKPTGIGGL